MTDNPLIADVTLATFPALVIDRSREVLVVVDFWASWCNPCRVLMPLLAKLAEGYQGRFVLVKVNTDQERDLAAQYGVRNLPTVKFFRHGKVVDEFMGAQSEGAVRGYLDRHIVREADRLRLEAEVATDAGDLDGALAKLHEALVAEPANSAVQFALARLLIARGDLAAAKQILQSLPDTEPGLYALLAYIELALTAEGADRAQLEQTLAANPADSDARFRLAALQVMAKEYVGAMDNLLAIVVRDRQYREDGARKALLTIFDRLGTEDTLVMRYRKRLVGLLH